MSLEDRVAYLERRMAELVGAPEDEARNKARNDQLWAKFNEHMTNIDATLGDIRNLREGES